MFLKGLRTAVWRIRRKII